MIDIQSLDCAKTYFGYEIGDSLIADAIQKMSKKEVLSLGSRLDHEDIATHVFMLAFVDNDWIVYESHAKFKGTHKQTFIEWSKTQIPEHIFCFEHALDVEIMEHFVKFNPGYSLADIGRFAYDNLFNIDPKRIFNNNPGIVCSEYCALCTISQNSSVCDIYDLPTYQIKPLHVQLLDPRFNEV